MTSLIIHDSRKEPEITPEDLIFRPMFYCDSESASKNLSNDISYDIVRDKKNSNPIVTSPEVKTGNLAVGGFSF